MQNIQFVDFNKFQPALQQLTYIHITDIVYIIVMSVERKNPLKRDEALSDASNGQMGEEPRNLLQSQIPRQHLI